MEGRRTASATARLLGAGRGQRGDQALVQIGIREGRKRQVRHMCESVGHPVVRLRRVRIGAIRDQGLRPGQFRDLTPAEVRALRRAVDAGAPEERTS